MTWLNTCMYNYHFTLLNKKFPNENEQLSYQLRKAPHLEHQIESSVDSSACWQLIPKNCFWGHSDTQFSLAHTCHWMSLHRPRIKSRSKLPLQKRKRYMSLVTRKPNFGVSEQMRLKLTCSATETSYRLVILDTETRGIILSRKRTTKALIRLHGCAGRSALLLFTYGINRFSHDVAHITIFAPLNVKTSTDVIRPFIRYNILTQM